MSTSSPNDSLTDFDLEPLKPTLQRKKAKEVYIIHFYLVKKTIIVSHILKEVAKSTSWTKYIITVKKSVLSPVIGKNLAKNCTNLKELWQLSVSWIFFPKSIFGGRNILKCMEKKSKFRKMENLLKCPRKCQCQCQFEKLYFRWKFGNFWWWLIEIENEI